MSSRADEMAQQQMSDENPTIPGAMQTYAVQPPGVVPRRAERVKADQNALVPQGQGFYIYKRFRITPVGMEIPDDATEDELLEIGVILDGLETSVLWNIGDWFNRTERIWGQTYLNDPQQDDYSQMWLRYQTLRDYAWIARSVQLSFRKRQLSFSHHRNVASLEKYPDLQERWLNYAIMHKLTVSVMRAEMSYISRRTIAEQIEILNECLSQGLRLSKKSPTPSGGDEEVSKKIKGNARFIAKHWDSLGQLSGKQREDAIEVGLEYRQLINEYLRRLGVG